MVASFILVLISRCIWLAHAVLLVAMTVAVGFMAMACFAHTITKASAQLSPLIESLTCCTFPRVLTHSSSTVKRNLALRAMSALVFFH